MQKTKDGFEDRREHFGKLNELAEEGIRTGKPCPPWDERVVKPFADPLQNVIEYTTKTREYHHPFHYKNIDWQAFCVDPSNSGLEMNPVNSVCGRTDPEDNKPGDYIEISEVKPIVRVVVIGSACTPPGWVGIEAEPCEGFRRPDEVAELMPLRFRIDNLWGTHIRGDCWIRGGWLKEEAKGFDLPENFVKNWPYGFEAGFAKDNSFTGVTGKNSPNTGMSCAVFEIPASKKIRVMGGSMPYGWTFETAHGDDHYSFRMIRTTVLDTYEAVVEG